MAKGERGSGRVAGAGYPVGIPLDSRSCRELLEFFYTRRKNSSLSRTQEEKSTLTDHQFCRAGCGARRGEMRG